MSTDKRHAMLKMFAIIALAALIGGCMPIERTVNHPIDTSQLGQFRAGITTPADVERVYGAPTSSATDSQTGHLALIYAYSNTRGEPIFGSTHVHAQGVVFIFDANGRLIRYTTRNTNGDVH